MKKCSKCKKILPESNFHKDKQKLSGLASSCVYCRRDDYNSYAKEHREQSKARSRKHYKDNKLKYFLKMKLWQSENKDKLLISARKWRKLHPEKITQYNNDRRARVLGVGGTISSNDWKNMCDKYGNKCLKCGKEVKLTIDHVIPVSLGGRNDIENAQPLCKSCNSSKNVKIIDFRGDFQHGN